MKKFTSIIVNLLFLIFYSYVVYMKFNLSPLLVIAYAIIPLPTIFFLWCYISTRNLYIAVLLNSINIFAGFFLYAYFYVEYFDSKGKALFYDFTNISLFIFLFHLLGGIITNIFAYTKEKNLKQFPFFYTVKIFFIFSIYFLLFSWGMQKYSENVEKIIKNLRDSNPTALSYLN